MSLFHFNNSPISRLRVGLIQALDLYYLASTVEKNVSSPNPRRVTSFIEKALLWIGGSIALYFAIGMLFFASVIGYVLFKAGQPPVVAPRVQVNPQPHSKYLIKVSPILQAQFLPTSAEAEVVHVIKHDPSSRSCLPASLETGTEYPFYPVTERPKVQVLANGDVAFVATRDYIKSEDFYGNGKCRYDINFATLILRNSEATFEVPLSWKDFNEFGGGDKTKVIFCISGRDKAVQSVEGSCNTHLNNLPAEVVMKFHPMFIVEAKSL